MFESIAVDQPNPIRKIAGPVSLLLHAVAGSTVILAALWRVGEPGEPPVFLPPVFLPELPQILESALPKSVPAAGDRSGGHRSTENPELIPEPKMPRALPLNQNFSIGINYLPAAILTGASQPSGRGPGTGAADPKSGSGPCILDCDGPFVVGGNVVAPIPLFQPSPSYPEPMRHVRSEGTVLLRAVIGINGAVEDLSVERADSKFFAEAALAAVARWRYRSATLNGRPVRAYLDVGVDFRLQ